MPTLPLAQLDVSKITLGKTGDNQKYKGSKYVPLLYAGRDAIEQQFVVGADGPAVCPFGLDKSFDGQDKCKLGLAWSLAPEEAAIVKALDDRIVELVAQRDRELLGAKKNQLQLLDAFKPLFHAGKDDNPPFAKARVKVSIDPNKPNGKLSMIKIVKPGKVYELADSDALVPRCGVVAKLRLGAVYVAGKTFNLCLEYDQVYVYPPASAPALEDEIDMPDAGEAELMEEGEDDGEDD